MAQSLTISPVTCTDGYRVKGSIYGVPVSFLLDTGAVVTLLREDKWKEISAGGERRLRPWSTQRLVGVDGSPLDIRGCAAVDFVVADESFTVEVVVIGSLTSEAILGLDFLREVGVTMDLKDKQLIIADRGCCLPLDDTGRCSFPAGDPHVRVVNHISIPPFSELEVMAAVLDPTGGGPWLLQASPDDRPAALVASALVEPRAGEVPVRLLNPRAEMITIRNGTQIASLHPVQVPSEEDVVVAAAEPQQLPQDKQEVLWAVAESLSTELSKGEREQFYHLLLMYADVFASSDSDLGHTSRLQHEIYTGDSSPIRQAFRRISPQRRSEVQELLATMLQNEVIQPSSSPWASPIVLVKKKYGNVRFCVDYRKLNSVTRKDAYPLPRIDDTLTSLAGSSWFSTLDLLSGYWQVEMAKQDRAKTAFCTTEGLFEFKTMPFGLCNAPATSQHLMDLVLAGLQMEHCLVYLDDVIVIGRSFAEHLQNLQAVFQRLRQAGLKLKPRKCTFFQQEVQYLGHIVSREGIATDPGKVQKVEAWPIPSSTREVQ